MKLTKENVYVNLQGKTKEELTDLWNFLTSNWEKPYRDLECFLDYSKQNYELIGFTSEYFCGLSRDIHKYKTEVTIDQLKQIIKPMETLKQQLQNAEAEVKRLQSLIEEENKPKVGDWIFFNNGETKGIDVINSIEEDKYSYCTQFCCYREAEVKKITNKDLIKLLEQEIK